MTEVDPEAQNGVLSEEEDLSSSVGPISEHKRGQKYLDDNHIPQLFQSLMSTLMLEKPDNHLDFLHKKLEEMKDVEPHRITWETFIYNLHPKRDKTRLEFIKDDEHAKWSKDQKQFADESDDENPDFKPEVFKLTEAKD